MQLATLLTPDFSFQLLLTLAHFLWQGAAICLIAFLLLQILRNPSPKLRCNILMLSLLAMLAAPNITFILLSSADVKVFPQALSQPPLDSTKTSPADISPAPILPLLAPIPSITPQSPASIRTSIDWRTRLQSLSPFLAIGYFCIVLLLLSRILLGLHAAHRLCRHSQPVEPRILAALARQMTLLHLTLKPALAYCTQITTPILVGILRPTILLPLSLTSNLSIPQIDSILAHELAHIRRLDPIFIIVQRLIEALLFFHPLVWLISRRLEIERERAADQLVLNAGHNNLDYASALIQLAESILNPKLPTTHLAATSHFRSRILSILNQPPRQTLHLTFRSSLILLAVIFLSCLLLPRLWAQTQPAKPATQPTLLTREQLLQRVTDLRSRVKDISVSTTDVVTKGPPNMVTNAHRTVVMKRDMIYVDQVLSSGENDSYRIFQRHISFDGKQTTAVGAPPGRAAITKGRSRELDTQTIGFFTVNLLNPPGLPRSLLGLLQHTPYNIRKDVELIDGHPCQVLEFSEFMGDTMNIWLDLERGLLPIRHRSFRPDGQLWFECNVEKAAEVEKGLWFATRAHCTTFPVFKNLAELAGGIEQVIILDGDSKGLPLIEVNQDPDDSIFDLASNLSVGTMVANMDQDRQWRVVGFSKDKKPATKPAAATQPSPPPLMAAPVITPDRKVEFDLKPWGQAIEGVSLRFRLNKENGPGSPYLDFKNSSQQNLKYDFGRPRLEFDQKWYFREDEKERLIDLSAGRTYQAIGPIFLGANWIDEQDHQRVIKAAGKHMIRVKFIAQPADGKGKPIEVVTAPLIVEFDAHGFATTQPAQ